MVVGELALIAAAIFFGAALYIIVAEQPARLHAVRAALGCAATLIFLWDSLS